MERLKFIGSTRDISVLYRSYVIYRIVKKSRNLGYDVYRAISLGKFHDPSIKSNKLWCFSTYPNARHFIEDDFQDNSEIVRIIDKIVDGEDIYGE